MLSSLSAQAYHVIRPEPIEFISYPYEWSFTQFRDAGAGHALEIQLPRDRARSHALKDAKLPTTSSFTRALRSGSIRLSFEVYNDGEPWVAYRQFCEYFLAPLARS